MKKMIMILMLIAIVSAVQGCRKDREDDDDAFTEVLFALKSSENENAGWLAMIDAANEVLFTERINISVQIIVAETWPDYYTKLASKMADRSGPTIGRIAESFIPQMIQMNQIVDLSDVVDDLDMENYYEKAFEGVINQDGTYYGLPTGIQHMLTYYNKNLYDAYNDAHPEDPIPYPSRDWDDATRLDEMDDIALKLSSGTGSRRVFGLSAAPYLAFAGMYAKSLGGHNIFDDQGNLETDTSTFRDVYRWYDGMIRDDHSLPRPNDTIINSSYDMFLQQRVVTMIDGAWWVPSFQNIESFDIGIAAIPSGLGASYTTQFVDAFFMLRTARDVDSNKKALKALMSEEAAIALASTGTGGVPIHRGASDTYAETLSQSFSEEDIACFFEGLEHTLSVPYTTYYETVDQAINQKMDLWLTGQMSADDFVSFIHSEMQKGMGY